MLQIIWSISEFTNFLDGTPQGGNVGQKGLVDPNKDEICTGGVYLNQLHH